MNICYAIETLRDMIVTILYAFVVSFKRDGRK